jgi:phosphatidylserine/phosphatidylglycerophosphate/cardiolipin synthase-like enzyme
MLAGTTARLPACSSGELAILEPKVSDPATEPLVLLGHEYLPAFRQLAQEARDELLISNFLVGLFGTRHKRFAHALTCDINSAMRRGCDVRLLSHHPLPAEIRRALLCQARSWKSDGLMHAKLVIKDRRVILLGSHNLTFRGTTLNKEASVLFSSEEGARRLRSFYLSTWANATPY